MAVMPEGGDTIFALSTAGLPSAIAIVRTSGPDSGAALEALAGNLPEPKMARLVLLRDPLDDAAIDRAIVLWLPGPDTVTGEDIAEFHIHGSKAVAAKNARCVWRDVRSAPGGGRRIHPARIS